MPYNFTMDPSRGIAVETWSGQLLLDQVSACIEERHAHPQYHESTPRLVDLTDAHGDLSLQDIAQLAKAHAESAYRGICAFVAPNDMQFGLSRMFEAKVGAHRSVAVFRDRDEALRWLEAEAAATE